MEPNPNNQLTFGISPNLKVKDSNKSHRRDDKKTFVITSTPNPKSQKDLSQSPQKISST